MGKTPEGKPGAVRWVHRDRPRPDLGENVLETVLVLQQAWKNDFESEPEWRDVPIAEE